MMMPFGSFQGWPAMWCSYRFRFLEIPPGSVGWFNSTDPSKLWILPNSSLRSHPWWRSTWHEICDSRIEPMPRKDGSPYSWPWTKRAAQEFTGFPYWIQAPRFTNRSKIFKDLIRNGGYWMIFGRLSTTLSRHIENQMHVDRTCILRWYPIIYSKICVVQFISKSSTCAELMGQIYRHSIWSRVYLYTSIRVVWVPALDRFVTFHTNGTQPPQQRPLSKPKPKLPPASALSAAGTMKLTTRSLDSASSGWQNAASVQAPF